MSIQSYVIFAIIVAFMFFYTPCSNKLKVEADRFSYFSSWIWGNKEKNNESNEKKKLEQAAKEKQAKASVAQAKAKLEAKAQAAQAQMQQKVKAAQRQTFSGIFGW